MVKRLFNPLIARFAAVAALLVLALAAPAVFAAEHEPCTMADDGSVTCSYDENGTDPVATLTSADPEGLGIDWDVTGADAADFEIDGGVLTFKESPNFEMSTARAYDANSDGDTDDDGEAAVANRYRVMVRSTEVRPEGDDGAAQSNMTPVTVTVTNVDESGTVTLSRLQSRVEAGGLTASLTDPDRGTNDADQPTATWQWSVAKVSRPELENDDHWQPAGMTPNTSADYMPAAGDADKSLRVKASYTDGQGAGKAAYVLSDYPVLAALVPPATNNAPEFPGDGDYTRELPESTAVGANVGAPVRATDANSGDILTYVLTGTDEDFFAIDKASGQITVAAALDFERTGGATYTVTVTAYDPSNEPTSGTRTVTITTTDVNEEPAVAGAAEVATHDEKNSVEETDTYTALSGGVHSVRR